MTVQEVADKALTFFEMKERSSSGKKFWSMKDDRPQWLYAAVYAAHDGHLPDDTIYDYIHDALEVLSEYDEPDEAVAPDPDVYTSALVKWLASASWRIALCDDVMKEQGPFDCLENIIRAAQYEERERVLSSIRYDFKIVSKV